MYTQAVLYKDSNTGFAEGYQHTGIIQKGFILHNQICANKVIVSGEISKEEIIQMVTNIIKRNRVLRSRVSNDEKSIIEFRKYNEPYYIPYVEDIVDEQYADIMFNNMLHDEKLYNDTKNLVYPFIFKVSDEKHIIYLAIHHCVWDNVSAELLVSEFNNYKSTPSLEDKKEIKKDNFCEEFYKCVDSYLSYINQLSICERKSLQYSSNQFEDEKFSNDIICWLMTQFHVISLSMDDKIDRKSTRLNSSH